MGNKTQHDKLMDIAKSVQSIGIEIDRCKGLMEQIQDEQNNPKPEVSIKEVISRPVSQPRTNIIYSGLEFIKKLCEKYPKIFGHFKY